MKKDNSKALFQEKQKFTQWWLWVLLIGTTLIPVYGVYKQVFMGQEVGDRPMSDTGMIIFLVFMLVFLFFFWKMQLITEITNEHIDMKFFPFSNKTITWSEVESAEVINYGFVGGWGVRIGTKYGTVYNTSGKIGLAIKLKSGKKICIGTQKGEELKSILNDSVTEFKKN